MSNNHSSDFGFLVFLAIAAIILIPLYFGLSDLSEFFRIARIVLIVVFCIVVIITIIVGIVYYKRKVQSRQKTKEMNEETKQEFAKKSDSFLVRNEKKEVRILRAKKEKSERRIYNRKKQNNLFSNEMSEEELKKLQQLNSQFDL